MGTKTGPKWDWVTKVPKKALPNNALPAQEAANHPLKSLVVSNNDLLSSRRASHESSSKPVAFDPLQASLEGSDPLSLMAAETDWDPADPSPISNEQGPDFFLKPWSEQRSTILSKFTTSQKMSMITSFLAGGEKLVPKSTSTEGVYNRLEQLDDFEEGSLTDLGRLTQQQYTESIQQLNQELIQAWQQDLRVKALKIAIQCAKLLVDTSVIQFYPSKFVLITDILDTFGNLVYERLRAKAEYYPPGSKVVTSLPENFTPNMVPESAKETCRNWFYKIASIRELVPRLYVEAAILKCYSFLTDKEFSQALSRLTKMTRGIGDPLVAVYARCYLCRVGMSVPTIDRHFLNDNFCDFLLVYDQLFNSYTKSELVKKKVDTPTYLGVYAPALDWILQGLSHRAPLSLLDQIVDKCAAKKNNGLLLNSILSNFRPNYVSTKAKLFVDLIIKCTDDSNRSNKLKGSDDSFPRHVLMKTLGECLQQNNMDNPAEIVQSCWGCIAKFQNPAHFMACAQVWAPVIIKNLSCQEVNYFLEDIIQHVKKDGKSYNSALLDILNSVVLLTPDFESIFSMDRFLPVLDLFGNDDGKVTACRKILELVASKSGYVITDPVTKDALMFISKILHDSVNSLTVEDEKRQIGQLISQFIRKMDFGRDFEKQLSYYVEARGTFCNIDSIQATLVHCVNRIASETGKIVKSHHTRKTASFVRACAAYCYITIPSISSDVVKLQLYMLTTQVSLFNQCLGQADACIEASLSLLCKLPQTMEIDGKMISSETFISEYVCNLLSTLLVVPDNRMVSSIPEIAKSIPDQGMLYLTKGLIRVLQHYLNENNIGTITKLLLFVIDMLATSAQPDYPYHVKKVDSNDVLYGSDPSFIKEINNICSVLIDDILKYLKVLGNGEQYSKQSQLAFQLFIRIVLHADIEAPGMATLALNLWNLSHRHGCLDTSYTVRTVSYLKQKSACCPASDLYKDLLSKLA